MLRKLVDLIPEEYVDWEEFIGIRILTLILIIT